MNKINFDMSNPEIVEVVEYYNKIINDIINIYEGSPEINNMPIPKRTNLFVRGIKYLKNNGLKQTIIRCIGVRK